MPRPVSDKPDNSATAVKAGLGILVLDLIFFFGATATIKDHDSLGFIYVLCFLGGLAGVAAIFSGLE